MLGEIIAVGNELTSGRIVNSTSYFAASHLFAAGHKIHHMATVGDEAEKIGAALLQALERADFVVVTGGLGSTSDDITVAAAAEALDRPQTFYPEIMAKIRESKAFAKVPAMEKMAWLPSGAEVLKPGARVAGFMLCHGKKPIFFLPGIPSQMRELMLDRVIPRLATWKGGSLSLVRQQVYKVVGLEEAEINQRLAPLEGQDSLVSLGYYPMAAEVHVSLTVCGETAPQAEELFAANEDRVLAGLGQAVYGRNDDTLAKVTGALLAASGLGLGLAESCTGGLMAHDITGVAGSSAYFNGSVVAYANEVKERLLGVRPETLLNFGAVSEETAREMVAGARRALGVDLAVAITGIAGPDGGTEEKPVGTVCFGLATPQGSREETCHFSGSRGYIQAKAAAHGLDMVRRYLLGQGEEDAVF
ncbi:MAG: CinA family nicotinamide mononucleotide deamidase-related protein [Thermodesulfobacteriota bacterium]